VQSKCGGAAGGTGTQDDDIELPLTHPRDSGAAKGAGPRRNDPFCRLLPS
jgi:hypothetical protein